MLMLGHDAVHKKALLSAFISVPVGCGEVPKLVLGGNNNFQGNFFTMSFFFWPKTPALNVPPAHYDYRFLSPKRVSAPCVQRIARGRAAGCGVVQRANETRQSAAMQAQAQHAQLQRRHSASVGANKIQ